VSTTLRRGRSAGRGRPVRRDLTATAGVLFPADVLEQLGAPERGALRIDVTAESQDGTATRLSGVLLTRRADGADGTVRWWGESDDGLLAVRLDGRPGGEWTGGLSANGVPERVGGMIRLLDMLELLRDATHVGWSLPGGPTLVRGAVGTRTLRIQDGYGRYLRALGRVAEHAGTDLRVPDAASADHVHTSSSRRPCSTA
jgi:hypothetical protein